MARNNEIRKNTPKNDLDSLRRVREHVGMDPELPPAVSEICCSLLLEVVRKLEDHGYGQPTRTNGKAEQT